MVSNESRIKDFLDGFSFESLPQSTLHEAKRALLDTLGCMIAGVDTPMGNSLNHLARRFSDSQGAAMLGVEQTVAPFFAAMGNGFLANAHDADDGHRMSRLHTGGIVIPAALAAAQELDCTGSRFLEAVVIGYELGLRAGMASTVADTYYGSAYGSTFGAAAAAGWLLGLASDQIVNAMGICDMHAPNCMLMGWINARQVPMIKEGMGWSAATGIMAAYMAQEGITGTLALFEGRSDTARIDHLGSDYEIERRYYKPGPGCRWTHAPLQTLLDLMREHNLCAQDVASIHVRNSDKAAQLDNPAPTSIDNAEYSIPFVLGAALIDGEFGPDQMTPQKLADPVVLEQARKVTLASAPEFERLYPAQICCDIRVTTRDEQVFTACSKKLQGDWDDPLSDGQLRDKFALMTRNRLVTRQCQTIADRIMAIETEASLQDFMIALHAATINPGGNIEV